MNLEFQCLAVFGEGPHPLLRDAVSDFRLDLQGDGYERSEQTCQVRNELVRDRAGVSPDPAGIECLPSNRFGRGHTADPEFAVAFVRAAAKVAVMVLRTLPEIAPSGGNSRPMPTMRNAR